jgi:sialic acid synthase SpsE
VRTVEQALGTSRIQPAPSEEAGRREYRLSCVAAEPLRPGQTLAEHSIAYRRPGTGLPPSHAPSLVGRRIRRTINAGEQLALTDVE